MKTIVIGHPTMGRGGSEAAAMWLIQSLKDDFDVTLVTTRTVDIDDPNHFYGTTIQPGNIKIRIAPSPYFMKINANMAGLRGAFYSRFTRQIGKDFDLCISAYNLSDWGVPALHFIADFAWDRDLANKFDPTPTKGSKIIHRDNMLRKAYLQVFKIINGKAKTAESFFDGSHHIVANSQWSAGVIKGKYGYDCDAIVYPPVVAEFKSVPWDQKEFGFVSIGRISPEKRIEQQIEILEKVRGLGHYLHFHIIGGCGDDPYGRMIRKKCVGKTWITLEGQKSGQEKEKLLTGHRFAIHTRPHEPFGITVAELVEAGCLPFLPNSGGQTEIVPFEQLQFSMSDEAVSKINDLLLNEEKQKSLIKQLDRLKHKFSIHDFCTQARMIVDRCLTKNERGAD